MIVDLSTGSERRLPSPVSGAWLTEDGTVVVGSQITSLQLWTLAAPSDPAALRALLGELTDATIAPDSTRVTFPEP